MNSEVFTNILSAQVQANASKFIGRRFILQQVDEPKHAAKAAKEVFRAKRWTIPDWPSQSPDLNPTEPFIS
ncbi:hypothetical protein LDENG_00176060 [Lucifuga dentata]|nr:hypothetical protein LDENG_00176060 [Lucifuga dentata]